MARLSKRKSRIILVFACTVMVAAVLAVKLSSHEVVWLLGLTASIPLFAAIVGAFPERNESDQS